MTPDVHRLPLARRFAEFATVRLRACRGMLRGDRPGPAEAAAEGADDAAAG
jgi:hypothetical protein